MFSSQCPLDAEGPAAIGSWHLNDHRLLVELAAEAGAFLRCATKWLARFRKVVHRITGNRQQGSSTAVKL